jgi:hypothetical protein
MWCDSHKGLKDRVTFFEIRQMTGSARSRGSNEEYPSLMRSDVSSTGTSYKIHLPEILVREVGFTSSEFANYPAFLSDRNSSMKEGAMVAWYYHKQHNKALLSDGSIHGHSEVELLQVCKLQTLSEKELELGDHGGARVSLIKGLPDNLYELRTCSAVILKPAYSERCSELDGSFVSVYPASRYDQGELPNMKMESHPRGNTSEHINVI